MDEKLQAILELPTSHKLGILFGTVLLLAGGYWYLFFAPVSEQVVKLDEKVNGRNGLYVQISQEQGIADNLDKFLVEVDMLDVELKKAIAQLPDKREIHALLAKISDTASDSGLEVRMFKPQGESKKDFYAEVPVEIEVQGTFHQVATFFDAVGKMERIVALDRFNMIEPIEGEDRIDLKTRVIATTFRFLDESERPKQTEVAQKRRGRGAAATKGGAKKL